MLFLLLIFFFKSGRHTWGKKTDTYWKGRAKQGAFRRHFICHRGLGSTILKPPPMYIELRKWVNVWMMVIARVLYGKEESYKEPCEAELPIAAWIHHAEYWAGQKVHLGFSIRRYSETVCVCVCVYIKSFRKTEGSKAKNILKKKSSETNYVQGFPWWSTGLESALQCKRHGFWSLVGKLRSHVPQSN